MTYLAQQIAYMVDMLPESEQNLASEFVKRLVLAWDPDFVKLTMNEREKLLKAEEEISHGDFVNQNDINWE